MACNQIKIKNFTLLRFNMKKYVATISILLSNFSYAQLGFTTPIQLDALKSNLEITEINVPYRGVVGITFVGCDSAIVSYQVSQKRLKISTRNEGKSVIVSTFFAKDGKEPETLQVVTKSGLTHSFLLNPVPLVKTDGANINIKVAIIDDGKFCSSQEH
jgi:hypothetical protein